MKQQKVSSKVEIPDAARKEIEFLFHLEIITYLQKFKIPNTLALNLEQIPIKYVLVSNETMTKYDSLSFTIKGSDNKQMITGTFVIILSRKFLSMQLIYGGKTNQSIPRVGFPERFCLSVYPKHFSYTDESLKFLNEIIIPYLYFERSNLKLVKEQKALIEMNLLTCQMINAVFKQYQDSNILIVNVPKNMTKYHQLLDLTVNGYYQWFLKQNFSECYSSQVGKHLINKLELEYVEVKLRLLTLKLYQAGCIIEFFNKTTSSKGAQVFKSDWLTSRIKDTVNISLEKLHSTDPFEDSIP